MRVTQAIDEPVGWAHSWISNGPRLHFNNSKVEVGLLIWAGINKDERVGDGLKHLPELLPDFRRQFPQAVVQEKICIFQEDHDFYTGH